MPLILKTEDMAVSSKDIETLLKRYSSEASNRGVSVTQFFESNGVPYHVFEKWYKKSSLIRSGFYARFSELIWNAKFIRNE